MGLRQVAEDEEAITLTRPRRKAGIKQKLDVSSGVELMYAAVRWKWEMSRRQNPSAEVTAGGTPPPHFGDGLQKDRIEKTANPAKPAD